MSFKESEGELYQIINVDAFGLSNEPGKPALPFRIYHMLLPDDAEARVQLNFVYSRTYEGFNIHPAQMEIIADEEDVHDYSFIKDEEFITYFVSGNRIY